MKTYMQLIKQYNASGVAHLVSLESFIESKIEAASRSKKYLLANRLQGALEICRNDY